MFHAASDDFEDLRQLCEVDKSASGAPPNVQPHHAALALIALADEHVLGGFATSDVAIAIVKMIATCVHCGTRPAVAAVAVDEIHLWFTVSLDYCAVCFSQRAVRVHDAATDSFDDDPDVDPADAAREAEALAVDSIAMADTRPAEESGGKENAPAIGRIQALRLIRTLVQRGDVHHVHIVSVRDEADWLSRRGEHESDDDESVSLSAAPCRAFSVGSAMPFEGALVIETPLVWLLHQEPDTLHTLRHMVVVGNPWAGGSRVPSLAATVAFARAAALSTPDVEAVTVTASVDVVADIHDEIEALVKEPDSLGGVGVMGVIARSACRHPLLKRHGFSVTGEPPVGREVNEALRFDIVALQHVT